MPINENILIIPVLIILYNSPNYEAKTSGIIAAIEKLFTLDSQDSAILDHRNDKKFTQIVRNLKSHKTLSKKGFADEVSDGFKLTNAGKFFLEENLFV